MKKALLLLLLAAFLPAVAEAQKTREEAASSLMGLGMPHALALEVATLASGGTVIPNNTYLKARNAADSGNISVLKVDGTDDTVLASDASDTIKLTPEADANRLFTFGAASDAAHTVTFGDDGVTATQTLTIGASTADADDDSTVSFRGGGITGNGYDRGAFLTLYGNEKSGSLGSASLSAGVVNGGVLALDVPNGTGTINIRTGASFQDRWKFEADGDFASNGTNGGAVVISRPGKTLELQEGTAADACMGTLTANGATPVVTSTTCAATGARIFLSRTGAESAVANAWVSAITNGASFAVTGEAADTGSYNYLIIKEAP